MGARATTSPHSRTAWGWYARVTFFVLCALVWPCIVLAPRARWAHCVARAGARLWIGMTGLRLEVRDRDHLHRLRLPCVFVANHTSKLDAIVLLAALPLRFAFVAKSELARSAFLRWPLHRLGTLFVDRHPRHSNGSATAQAIARLRQGDSLFFFPEGTFGDVPGLLAFHRGAFVAAANAGADVVPIALRGTRDVLPDLRRLPRRGSLEVAVGAPIDPTEPEASPRSPEQMAAASLRQARAFIARGCGEPDLARPETEPRSGTS